MGKFSQHDFSLDDVGAETTDTEVDNTPVKVIDPNSDYSLTVEDLFNGVIIQDSAVNETEFEEDLIDFNKAKKALEDKGYCISDNATFDTLTALNRRQDKIDSGTVVSTYCSDFNQIYSEALNALKASKAVMEGDISDNSNYIRDNISTRGNDKVFVAAEKYVTEMTSLGEEVTVQSVMAKMRNNVFNGVEDTDNIEAELESHLSQIIPKLMNYHAAMTQKESSSENTRKQMSLTLMRRQRKLYKQISANTDNIYVLKQISLNEDSAFFKCEKCGAIVPFKKLPINSIIFATARNTENSNNRYNLPEPLICPCGALNIFTHDEYAKLVKVVNEYYRYASSSSNRTSVLNKAIEQMCRLGTGAIFLATNPPATEIVSADIAIVNTDVANKDLVEKAESEKENGTAEVVIDDAEFAQAVKFFKQRLQAFNSICTASSLGSTPNASNVNFSNQSVGQSAGQSAGQGSISPAEQLAGQDSIPSAEQQCFNLQQGPGVQTLSSVNRQNLAKYITSTLGHDYCSEKLRALFSIVYHIKEVPIFNDVMDVYTLLHYENSIIELQGLTEKAIPNLDLARRKELLVLWYALKDYFIEETSADISEDQKIADLIENVPHLTSAIEEFKATREKMLNFIARNLKTFAYWKIINVSTIETLSFDYIIGDSKTLEVFESLADYMLLVHYAESYYSLWKNYKLVKQNFDSVLTNNSQPQTVKAAVKVNLAFVAERCGGSNEGFTNTLKAISVPIKRERQQQLKAISQVIAGNYYRFLKSVDEMSNPFVEMYSGIDSLSYGNAVTKLKNLAKDLGDKTEFEYYLVDFTKEEISDNLEALDTLTYGLYTLKRLPNESVDEYVARYKEFSEEDKFTRNDSYCHIDKFRDVLEEILILYSETILSNTDFKTYNTSLFMSQLLFSVANWDTCAIYSFLRADSKTMNFILNSSNNLDLSSAEFDVNLDFYRILNGNYSDVAEKVISEYFKIVEFKNINLADAMTGSLTPWKASMLEEMLTGIESACKANSENPEGVLSEIAVRAESPKIRNLLGVD